MEVTNITYLYPEDSRERLAAEEWITDKQAMNKDQTKLINRIAKFRIKTIDLVESLNEGAQKSLGAQNAPVATTTTTTTQQVAPYKPLPPYLPPREMLYKATSVSLPTRFREILLKCYPRTGC